MAKKPDNEDFLTDDDLVLPAVKEEEEEPVQKKDRRSPEYDRRPKEPKKVIPRDTNDPRPHANVIPEYLKRKFGGRAQLPVSMDISYLMLPPITRKRHAVYELLQDTKIDSRIIEGDNAVKPPPTILPPTYMFYDDGELDLAKKNKLMKLVERQETVLVPDGRGGSVQATRDKLGQVEFINGQVTVPIMENYPFFVWMELCPWNTSNPKRKPGSPAIFKRIDQEHKSVHQEIIMMDLKRDAHDYLRKIYKDRDAIVQLASAMTNPTIPVNGVSLQNIYYTLRLIADNDPEAILFKAPDKKAPIRMDLISALDHGIIEYIPEHAAYYGSWTGDKTPIHTVVGNDPLEDLINFCSGAEGEETILAIQEVLGYWR